MPAAPSKAQPTSGIYELGGDHAWNYDEFAAAASEALGKSARYERISPEAEQAGWRAAGLDDATIARLTVRAENTRNGDVDKISNDLSTLIGRPTKTLVATMRDWV